MRHIHIKDALLAFAAGILVTLALLTIVIAICETIRPAQDLHKKVTYEVNRQKL